MHAVDNESSAAVAERVQRARAVQIARQDKANAHLSSRELERHCSASRGAVEVLERATAALGLSARGHHRILRVARTIADLAGNKDVSVAQMGEAIALRRFDRTRGTAAAAVPVAITGESG
jgi:magnesium chelatase family protein